MTLFWLMWVGLVLGGLIASLWYQDSGRTRWFRRSAKVAVHKPDARTDTGKTHQQSRAPARAGDELLPPPRVATHMGPPPGRPAG